MSSVALEPSNSRPRRCVMRRHQHASQDTSLIFSDNAPSQDDGAGDERAEREVVKREH